MKRCAVSRLLENLWLWVCFMVYEEGEKEDAMVVIVRIGVQVDRSKQR